MCDCLVSLTADGAVFAKNSDRPPGERQVVERHPPARLDGAAPLLCTWIEIEPCRPEAIGFVAPRPDWAWGVEHGVNEAGVAVGNEAVYTTLDPRGAPPGLPGIDLVRLALMWADSAAAAVSVITSLIERYGQGGSGHQGQERPYWSSFLIADARSAFVVDTSGREWAVEPVASPGSRAISNKTSVEEWRHPRQPVETLVEPRLAASNALLAQGPLTVDSAMAHLRSHAGGADGWTVCMHVPGVEATTAAMVAELPAQPGARPVAHLLLGSPCESEFVRHEL
jgi:secernin